MAQRTKPATAVVPGDIVLLGDYWTGEENPCRVVTKWKRLVRHMGQYKVHLEGVDIFTGRPHVGLYSTLSQMAAWSPLTAQARLSLTS